MLNKPSFAKSVVGRALNDFGGIRTRPFKDPLMMRILEKDGERIEDSQTL